jgi:RNA polymerase sigma factor (sigma-70 family)
MADSRPQSGFAGFSDPRFQRALQQALPLLEMLVEMAYAYNPDNSNTENPLPCNTCPKAGQCKKPCDLLEVLLPGKFAGSAILNNTAGDLIDDASDLGIFNSHDDDQDQHEPDRSFLRTIDRVRSDEIFGLYKNCFHLFTHKEWRVITLRVQQGQTYRAIGKRLGIATSTASDTFQRAKGKMEEYYRKKY